MTIADQATQFSLDDYPALYIVADEAAKAGRRRYTWLLHVDLALLAVAAIVGGIGTGLSTAQGTAVAVLAAQRRWHSPFFGSPRPVCRA